MTRALKLAARGRTSPNPMVGAVVVHDGEIVGEGFHPKAGEPHAEVFALRAAGSLSEGADLYVTLEPCCHHGQTPPCTEAVVRSGVRRVFAAMVDPNPRVTGRGIETLRAKGIQVEIGLLESQARELNRGFIKRVTDGRPFVLWKAAMSLDGKIATRTGDSRWITGEKARLEVHRLRSRSDAVITGVGTVLADDPELTVRGIRAANPLRVVVDSAASIPLGAKVLNDRAETLVALTERAPARKLDSLRDAGAEVLILPDAGGRVDLRALLAELGNLGLNGALLECGGELASSMLEAGLVDRGLLFIAPIIIGGRDSKTIVEGEGPAELASALRMQYRKIRRFGDDLAVELMRDS